VLQDLDKTLEALLRAELPAELRAISISFVAPDDTFPPSGFPLPAISLYRSGTQENHEVHKRPSTPPPRPAGPVLPSGKPVRQVDCYYVACAFSNAANNPEDDEHRILGELMRVFFRFREIPAHALQGSLQDQVVPIRSSTLLPTTRETGVGFWEALKVRPRPSLHYVITIGVDP
jgi:hypothetical protein